MKLESNHGSSNVFAIFVKKFATRFVMSKMIRSECLDLVKHIYLFNSSCNIDPSSMVTRHLKICVSFADK